MMLSLCARAIRTVPSLKRPTLLRGSCAAMPAVMAHNALPRACLRMMGTEVPVGAAGVNADGTPVDENGQPLSKNALKKLAKAAAIAAKKAQKAEEKAQAQAQAQQEVPHTSGGTDEDVSAEEEPLAPYSFTDVGVLMSTTTLEEQQRVYTPICELGAESGSSQIGQEVWVRGRVARLRVGASNCFIVLRAAGRYTVQAVFFKDKATPHQSKAMLGALAGVPN